MRIQVTNHYIGAPTGGRMIYPGVYEVGDPLLYEQENNLIEIGYAVPLPEPEVPPEMYVPDAAPLVYAPEITPSVEDSAPTKKRKRGG